LVAFLSFIRSLIYKHVKLFPQACETVEPNRIKQLTFVSDLLEETEPTQTPYEKRSDPIDKVTESIQS
jgi:hypothetical protein